MPSTSPIEAHGFTVTETPSSRGTTMYRTITRAYGTVIAGHCDCPGAKHRGRCRHLTAAGATMFDDCLALDLADRLSAELGLIVRVAS